MRGSALTWDTLITASGSSAVSQAEGDVPNPSPCPRRASRSTPVFQASRKGNGLWQTMHQEEVALSRPKRSSKFSLFQGELRSDQCLTDRREVKSLPHYPKEDTNLCVSKTTSKPQAQDLQADIQKNLTLFQTLWFFEKQMAASLLGGTQPAGHFTDVCELSSQLSSLNVTSVFHKVRIRIPSLPARQNCREVQMQRCRRSTDRKSVV